MKLIVVILPLFAACSQEEQTADSRARAYYEMDSLLTAESVFVTFNDGYKSWGFKPADFSRSNADTSQYMSPEVQTAIEGSLRVKFSLFTDGGEMIAEGEFGLPMSPNWSWTIAIIHATPDPSVDCSDCQGSEKYDIMIPGHDDEWIYVLWRGRKT